MNMDSQRSGASADRRQLDSQSVALSRDAATLPARALAALPEMSGDALPTDIQVFPPGKDVEFTLQDYPGETFSMTVDETVAARAQADLERLLARAHEGKGPKPFADKNHEDAEATFHPKRFFWGGSDPKTGGVRVETDWTGFGAPLVKARALCYFSGNFLFNKATKKFLGLLNENIGGLVNRPGFATQQAFARGDAHRAPLQGGASNQNQTDTMTKEEISSIVNEAVKPLTDKITALEAKAKSAETAAAAKAGAENPLDKDPVIVSLETRLHSLETNKNETVRASAKATVATLGIKAGRIAAQDADQIKFWEDAIVADAKAADQLAKIPVNPALATIIANAGAADTSTGNNALPKDKATSDKIEAKAKAHMANGKLPFDQAWAKATEEVMAGR